MPKTYGGLFEKITSMENLIEAYTNARVRKRRAMAAMKLHDNWSHTLVGIRNLLLSYDYRLGALHPFTKYNSGKLRLIKAPTFRDRIIHHAIVQVLSPLYEKKFISDSYSCRVGKGTHNVVSRVEELIRYTVAKHGQCYILKCDISKFFPSINHAILTKILRRTIREERVINLVKAAMAPRGLGLPIGALTSQLLSNIYLDQLDHYLKDKLSVQQYVRYADDFVIVHHDKEYLRRMLSTISEFLTKQLALRLNPKTAIFSYKQGVDMCGYRIWPTHRLPRKRVVREAKRRLLALVKKFNKHQTTWDKVASSGISFLAYMSHCHNKRSTRSVFERLFALHPVSASIE